MHLTLSCRRELRNRRAAYGDSTDERSIVGKDDEESSSADKRIEAHRQRLDSKAMIVTEGNCE